MTTATRTPGRPEPPPGADPADRTAPADTVGGGPAAVPAEPGKGAGGAAAKAAGRGVTAGRLLGIVALVALGFVGYLLGLSELQATRTQDTLYTTFRGELAQEGDLVAPVAPPIKEGAAVAILEIPALDLRQVVVEGTTSGDLMRGPGHRRNSPLPGQPGSSVIYGRRSTFGAPFHSLPNLRIGDTVIATTGLGVSRFTVTDKRDGRVAPTPLTTVVNRLVLVTSAPSVSPTHTVIVTATLRSKVLPAGGARPAIYPDEQSLAGSPAAALPLMLWAQVLLLSVIAATWLFQRWDRWAAYLVSGPVVLAVLWNVYENLARLLPNML